MFEALIDSFPDIAWMRDKRFLMVTGAGKSGTTWVQKILDSHPEIHCRGEGKFGYLVSGLVSAFANHGEKVEHSNHIVYGEGEAFYRRLSERERRPVHQLAMAMAMLNGTAPIPRDVKYVGDKDPGYAFDIESWVGLVMPGSWVVHIVRDCRDVIHSHRHHRARTEPELEAGSDALEKFVAHQAGLWAGLVSRVHAYGDVAPERYYAVKYEALLADPVREIADLLGFLDVDNGDAVAAGIAAKTDFGVLSGGRSVGQEDRASFYRKGGSGDWRDWFEDAHHAAVRERAGETMTAFGYSLD